jgi:hypothetical protein
MADDRIYTFTWLERPMNRLAVIIFLVIAARSVNADCLEISGQEFEPSNTEFGAMEIQWKARIENHCNAAFDANLTIHFRDEQGESVYKVSGWTSLNGHESQNLGRRVYIPSRYYETITEVDVRAKPLKHEY